MFRAPLTGLKVLEFAGLAPGPFAGLFFADAGADVLRIDRPVHLDSHAPTADMLARRKASVAVNLKDPQGVALVQALARDADVLIDPFRPGVLERLGLGPDQLLGANPSLVYVRLTGFRRDGPYHAMAGHDINYLAVSGVLDLLGRAGEKPTPPWNILADFAGGGMMAVVGALLALAARQSSSSPPFKGRGQVVEANMVDGAAYLASFPRFALSTPLGEHPRGQNLLDSGCPYYDTYATQDGRYVAVGALEPQFFRLLVQGLGLDAHQWTEQNRQNRDQWPALRKEITAAFLRHDRDHWERVFDGTDACCTPVLSYREMPQRTHDNDMRPPVALRETPLLAVAPPSSSSSSSSSSADNRRGQGPGVAGAGYTGETLAPGKGAAAALHRWCGWAEGVEYEQRDGALRLTSNKAQL